MIQPVVWILFTCLLDEKNNGKLKKVSILYFLFYSFVGTFILLSLGSRGAVLILWGGVMLIYHYSQKAITFKQLLIIFLLVFLFAMSFRAYRHFLARGDWGFGTTSDASVLDVISRDFYATDLAYFYMDNVPDRYDFIHGQSFIGIPYFIIPRVVWSSKPKALGPDVLLIHFFPNYGLKSHMGPSLIGDLYINFSYMGIVAGMSILGLFYQIIEKYLNKGKGTKIEKSIVYVITAAFAFYLFKCSVFDAVTRLIVIWVFPIFLLLYLTRIRCLTKIS
jgi:oligosaccharide repeat unit polymerase